MKSTTQCASERHYQWTTPRDCSQSVMTHAIFERLSPQSMNTIPLRAPRW